jgi:hypothetical protein
MPQVTFKEFLIPMGANIAESLAPEGAKGWQFAAFLTKGKYAWFDDEERHIDNVVLLQKVE